MTRYNLVAIAMLLFVGAARAELHVEFAIGQASFFRIHKDNYWYQEPFPYEHDLTSISYRIGASKRINERWSLTAAYLNLGKNGVTSEAIPHDPAYELCANGDHSANGCGYATARFVVEGKARGLELGAVRHFGQAYLRGGAFVWFHELSVKVNEEPHRFSGTMLAPYIGVGIGKGLFFADVTYYHSISSSGFPVAQRAIVPMIGIRR